jgi:hypothetical protein
MGLGYCREENHYMQEQYYNHQGKEGILPYLFKLPLPLIDNCAGLLS